MCRVVNLYKEPYDVYIGRAKKGETSLWGNPFVIGKDGDRDEVIEKYRHWLWQQLKSGRITKADILSLDGKTLGCFCKPQKCHGDILVAALEWVKNSC